jgi:beta-lactamase regulating signal transducer with metallopeptidase domain
VIGMATWLYRLLYAALIATAGSLVMLALRRPITLHAGPRATVGLWSFLLLVTALALLWLNGHDMFLSQLMNDLPVDRWLLQLGLYDMRYMYPPKNGVFASLMTFGGLGFTWSGDVTAAVAAAFGVWALGAAVFWLRALIPHLRLRRALKRLPAADDPELARAIYLERSYLGITREVKAYILPGSGRGKRVFSPCVTGVRAPALVLPEDIWAELTPEERDAVVAHELMHVRKRDNVRNLVLLVFHGVFWFAPIFRIALRVMRRDLEFLRDRQVLGEGATGREKKVYADAIVSVAERCSKGYRPALHSGMLTGSGVGFRVRLIGEDERGGLRVFAWLAVLAAALCILAAAAVFFYVPYFTDKTLPWWYRFFIW